MCVSLIDAAVHQTARVPQAKRECNLIAECEVQEGFGTDADSKSLEIDVAEKGIADVAKDCGVQAVEQ